MFEAKTNGAKWREMSAETVDAAAPQAMPTQPSEGQRPIAELVIEDIRARAEAGERKYGTKLYAHNGRSALVDLYQELIDGAQYTRQALEEDYEGRALRAEAMLGEVRKAIGCGEGDDVETEARRLRATADLFRQRYEAEEEMGAMLAARSEVANRLRLVMEALGWDESKGEPVEWARAVVFARNEAQALIALRVGEIGELRAEIERAAIGAEVRAGQAALDLVADRMGRAAEIESLKAGLRALANVRDEGAVQTARWRDRALGAESSLDGAHQCVETMRQHLAMFERVAADQRQALADALNPTPRDFSADVRPTHDDLMRAVREWREGISERERELDRLRVLVSQTEAAAAALRGERDDLMVQLSAKTREAEDAFGVARQWQAEGQRALDTLAKRTAERGALFAAGLGIEAERARAVADLAEIEGAVMRHLEPLIDKEERGSAERVIIEAASAIERAREERRSSMVEAKAERDCFKAPDPAQATEEVGSAEVAPAAPVETPQATETQPDPGEGWRLLGPEEVIETGDQWWGGAMVGPVWLAASATIGETPAAINAHPRATEHRVFRRRTVAPIAQAPVVEPVTEVAIEARGSKFVIVRRAVAT